MLSGSSSAFAAELLPTQPLPPTSLDTLAHAATSLYLPKARPPAAAAATPRCGECGGEFRDGQEFFGHWLERHCRLHADAQPEESATQEVVVSSPPPAAPLSLEQCRGCDLVFVR